MKGVVLAGGLGSRLLPCTRVFNKHLLPVYNQPMIYYPLQTLKTAGIRDILIVTGGNSSGDFLKLLGSGSEFEINLYFAYQEGEGGIAAALKLAENFVDDKFIVMLGDNITTLNLQSFASNFNYQPPNTARILLKKVKDPSRFGVAEIDASENIVDIVEKPATPVSHFAVTGIYAYDKIVFEFTRSLKPSARGELEITDVNKAYLARNELGYEIMEDFWSDAGTFESLATASEYMRQASLGHSLREALRNGDWDRGPR